VKNIFRISNHFRAAAVTVKKNSGSYTVVCSMSAAEGEAKDVDMGDAAAASAFAVDEVSQARIRASVCVCSHRVQAHFASISRQQESSMYRIQQQTLRFLILLCVYVTVAYTYRTLFACSNRH
jgi:hypothetical protein